MTNRIVRQVTVAACCLSGLLLSGTSIGPARQQELSLPLETQVIQDPQDPDLYFVMVHTTGRSNFPLGLGLGLAFDGARAAFKGFDTCFPVGLFAASTETEADLLNLDGDDQTDRLVRIAWMDMAGAWPAGVGHATLLRAVFRRLADPDDPGANNPIPLSIFSLSQEPAYMFYPLRESLMSSSSVRRTLRSATTAISDPGATKINRNVNRQEGSTLREAQMRRVSERQVMKALAGGCSLDVDGNGTLDALTDGVLIMRYLFGFPGASLIQGAIGARALRNTAEAIIDYLNNASCAGMLDPDGNGKADALTDGTLILRYLFGFPGNALTANAIGPGATRTTPQAIAAFLSAYTATGTTFSAGPGGGTLSAAGLTLVIPQGALTQATQITITRVPGAARKPEDFSDPYRITGLPDGFAKDLTVEIELYPSGTNRPVGTKDYLSFETLAYSRNTGKVAMHPFLIEGTISGNTLRTVVPAHPALRVSAMTTANAPEQRTDDFRQVKAVELCPVSTPHFISQVPADSKSKALEILNLFEEAYTKLTSAPPRAWASTGIAASIALNKAIPSGNFPSYPYHWAQIQKNMASMCQGMILMATTRSPII